MTIKTWTASQFVKMKNSTKQPGSSPTPTSHTVRLKDSTSIVNPTIVFQGHVDPMDICYAYIDDFERYYFKNDMRYVGPETEIDFVSDPMASFKNEIEDYECLILRSSDSGFYNKYLPDALDPAETGFTESHALEPGTTVFTTTDFCCLLTVVGKSQVIYAGAGMATTYVLDYANLIDLNLYFNNSTFLGNLIQEFTNPMDAILSCKIVPISYSDSIWGNDTGNVYIGSQQVTGVTGKVLGTRWTTQSISLGVPSAITSLTDYRRGDGYTSYSAYLPFVGMVQVPFQAVDGGTFRLRRNLDLFTCDVSYDILYYSGDTFLPSEPIATYSGNFASESPVSHQAYSSMGVAGGIIATIGGAVALATAVATGGASLIPGAGAIAGGIGTTIKSLESHTQINGALSSGLGVKSGNRVILVAFTRKTSHSPVSIAPFVGLPTHKVDYIRSHSGYLQVYNPSVRCTRATVEELSAINSMLAQGFRYE